MLKHRKQFITTGLLLMSLMLWAIPGRAGASQIPVRENINHYVIEPDLCPTGLEEEYDRIGFHQLLLPVDRKDSGITIALSVPGKGRVHYSIGADILEQADTILPEVFEDADCTIPVANHYESNEVYVYCYNFDAPKEGTYYLRLTAPEITEDLPLNFSVHYYYGTDRELTEGIQAFYAVTDDIPAAFSVKVKEDGLLRIKTDNYLDEKPPVIRLIDDNGIINEVNLSKEGSAVVSDYKVSAGDYVVKVLNDSSYFRITYDMLDSTQPTDIPKTGEAGNALVYYSLSIACLLLLAIIRIKDAGKMDDYK